MLKKTITYTDYNGVERTEDCYFNLSKMDLMRMETSKDGGYSALVDRMIKSNDANFIMNTLEDLIKRAYCVKSDDGKRLVKSDELSTAFMQSPMYDILVFDMIQDPQKATEFINGILPTDVEDVVALKKTQEEAK